MQKPRYGPQSDGDDGDTIADTESKKSRSHSQSIKRNQKPGLRGDWRQANVWDTAFKSTLGTKYRDTFLPSPSTKLNLCTLYSLHACQS